MSQTTIYEYIWIDGNGGMRSKTRVLGQIRNLDLIPDWNYDGSSTNQANSEGNTEVLLKPVIVCADPLRKGNSFLVLCETFDYEGNVLLTNYRTRARNILNSPPYSQPWFGIEQEYDINFNGETQPITNGDGLHYCGVLTNKREREIVEEHLKACLYAGLTISGINAEVATRQWEFQIGPCTGISAADQTYIARFLLERIAEKHGARICYYPKPTPDANGKGCHINFSTKPMREYGGIDIIMACMDKLAANHKAHIEVYGADNHLRLTGKHETSSMDVFTYGKGTRNTSVRIPNQTVKDGFGYFEDRRPAANVELYQATSKIFETCCL
jgi:glutamine synthetase